jgi:hypothetical protein
LRGAGVCKAKIAFKSEILIAVIPLGAGACANVSQPKSETMEIVAMRTNNVDNLRSIRNILVSLCGTG